MTSRPRATPASQERDHLAALIKDASRRAKRFLYARALLLCHQGPHGPGGTVARPAQALGVAMRTIERLKQRCVDGRPGRRPLATQTASRPPAATDVRRRLRGAPDRPRLFTSTARGRCRRTVRLPVDKAVERGFADKVSHLTVQRILKTTTGVLT